MSKIIRNVIKPYVYAEVEPLLKTDVVTPRLLDRYEDKFIKILKEHNFNIGRRGVREIVVEVILDNFGIHAFGLTPIVSEPKVISDKTIRKYKKARKFL